MEEISLDVLYKEIGTLKEMILPLVDFIEDSILTKEEEDELMKSLVREEKGELISSKDLREKFS
jgi:hypothetical protein